MANENVVGDVIQTELDLANYQGCVTVKIEGGQHYIGLDNTGNWYWKPISEVLYCLLIQELSRNPAWGPNSATKLILTVGNDYYVKGLVQDHLDTPRTLAEDEVSAGQPRLLRLMFKSEGILYFNEFNEPATPDPAWSACPDCIQVKRHGELKGQWYLVEGKVIDG